MLAEIAAKRPARTQVVGGPVAAPDMSAAAARGEYNIWHHKSSTRDREPRKPAATRVNIAKDTGWTAGNDNPAAFICIYFAKGCCPSGSSCRFLHRPPLGEDLHKLSVTHDCFGRERHASNRSDMSGVGTWSKDQRTLYVGKLDPSTNDKQVRQAFDEFGELECCRVFADRGFAFVTYRHRGCAEFGYQAMMDQRLGTATMINVRWAEDDPNPRVKRRKAHETERTVRAAVAQAGVGMRGGGIGDDEDSALEARLQALRNGGGGTVGGEEGEGGGWQRRQQQQQQLVQQQLAAQQQQLLWQQQRQQHLQQQEQEQQQQKVGIIASNIAIALAKASGGTAGTMTTAAAGVPMSASAPAAVASMALGALGSYASSSSDDDG